MGMDTFVVQLWVPPDQTSCGTALRGVVRHVATGVETAFRGDDEVLRLLHVARGPRPGPPAPDPEVDPNRIPMNQEREK
jgi:hypothetical protein